MAHLFDTSSSYLTGETDDPAPDYFFVSKKAEPLLYDFIEYYKCDENNIKERLAEYMKKLLS